MIVEEAAIVAALEILDDFRCLRDFNHFIMKKNFTLICKYIFP